MRLRRSLVVACVLAIFSLGVAQAAPLNLGGIQFNVPDIFVSQVSVSYNAGTQQLTASGNATSLDRGSQVDIISGSCFFGFFGCFNLTATVDNAGNLSGGSFDIAGTVAGLGAGPTLLSGNLTAIGFPNAGGDPLEFLFTVTGGDAAGLFVGASNGIVMNGSGVPGTLFTSNFSNSGNGGADIAPNPEPSTIVMLLSTMGVGLYFVRKRNKVQAV